MQKKKILLITNHLYIGGVDKVVVDVANGLDKDKFDVSLIVLFKYSPDRFQIDNCIHVKTIFGFYFRGFARLLFLLSPKWLYKKIVTQKYDYEIAFQAGLPTRILANSMNKNARRYCWVHGIDMQHFEDNKKFDKIIFVSQSVKDYYQPLFEDESKLLVKYNPMNLNYIFSQSKLPLVEKTPDDAPIICNIGRLSPEKGVIRLLEVHKRLLDNGIRNYLWLIGDGTEKKSLVKYVNDNNLYQTVKFWGYQKNPYKFLSKSDFYVCPSYKEGFSVAATEAVLLGKPVVTTDVFGMKELLGENEYGIISANDTESLYGSVLKMLSDDCLKHYTQQAKIRSKEFCQINRINKIEELFE